MTAFVVLALALALLAVVGVVLLARDLIRTVRKLTAAVSATTERLAPLSTELQGELAVTSTEVAVLTASVEQLQKERGSRPRRRKSRSNR